MLLPKDICDFNNLVRILSFAAHMVARLAAASPQAAFEHPAATSRQRTDIDPLVRQEAWRCRRHPSRRRGAGLPRSLIVPFAAAEDARLRLRLCSELPLHSVRPGPRPRKARP